ncbi:hypothetical protein ACFQU7_42345 [Pseudoroseomonas wenyumeiae]
MRASGTEAPPGRRLRGAVQHSFLVAAALVRGRLTLAELEADALNDPVILALAARVSYAVDPDSPFPALIQVRSGSAAGMAASGASERR